MNHLDAERLSHLVRRDGEQSLPRTCTPQIEHGDDVADAQTTEHAHSAPDADVHGRRHVTHDFQSRRKLLQLQRHTQPSLHRLLTRHRHP